MHDFKYRGRHLYCEGVKVSDLARKFGTPLYVYSYHTLTDHLEKLQKAFSPVDPLICYSVKANSNLAILRALVAKGAGLDIVSGGELYRSLKAGCPAKRIVYASVGKTAPEIAEAIRKGILFFNVESLPELHTIERIAGTLGRSVSVAIRINPDVAPKTHHFITTGKLTNKFGIDLVTAERIITAASADFAHAKIRGLHIHIGSQITEAQPFVEAIKKVAAFIERLATRGVGIEYLNIGGGLGIIYSRETPQSAQGFADKVLPILKKTGLKIIMEPGRFIIGNAGILVARVLYVKDTPRKKFIITDSGMNDLIRPALYDAYHQVAGVNLGDVSGSIKADVVGPICESGDFFAKERLLPRFASGDYLAVMSAGAYGFSMASNYNSRPRPAEVMVRGRKSFLIRKRETLSDLVHNEIVPEFLRK